MPVYTQTFGLNEIFSGIWDADTPQHKAASADLNHDAAQHPNLFRRPSIHSVGNPFIPPFWMVLRRFLAMTTFVLAVAFSIGTAL